MKHFTLFIILGLTLFDCYTSNQATNEESEEDETKIYEANYDIKLSEVTKPKNAKKIWV